MSSINEAADQIGLLHNTLRKYLDYFELDVLKDGRKILLPQTTVKFLAEITRLKSNGWSLKQIKEFLEKQKTENTGDSLNDYKPEVSDEISKDESVQDHIDTTSAQNEAIENTVEEFKTIDPSLSQSVEVFSAEVSGTEITQVSPEVNSDESEKPSSFEKQRPPLTKDFVNREIAIQAKRTSRLYHYLGSRHSPRETAELQAILDKRVIFLNGLRYIRDNWVEHHTGAQSRERPERAIEREEGAVSDLEAIAT
ncbi:MAG: MerR family transcriptional regulator [Candidatus Caenarcaniphilales bacterium]|nr:MerR family transcriptional regulator [Candidatus Caenarcaniphilales bacterium]